MSVADYDALAPFYDAFQSGEADFAWAEWLDRTYRANALPQAAEDTEPVGVDLGCGTGQVTQAMTDLGWDMIGVDNSPEMLSEAANRDAEGKKPLYILQDITQLELYGTCNLMYTTLDTLNHLPPEALGSVFANVHRYLDEGGVFLFDLLNEDYMAKAMGRELYYRIDDEQAVLWQNNYRDGVNRSQITVFAREGELYRREDSEITEYYHDPETVKQQLETLGFRVTAERAEALADKRQMLSAVKTERVK